MGAKYTEAQAAASRRHLEKLDTITLRVPKGDREAYKKIAEEKGKSLNQYIIDCMEKGRE